MTQVSREVLYEGSSNINWIYYKKFLITHTFLHILPAHLYNVATALAASLFHFHKKCVVARLTIIAQKM